MYAALVSIDLRIPGMQSRKEKRQVVKSLSDRIRTQVRCSVAEVDHLDSLQRCVLGVAAASGSVAGARTVVEHALRVVEREPRVELISAPIVVVSDED